MSDALSVSVSVPTKVITEYYYSRWVSLAFSLLLSSASGSGYAFGIWSSVLKGPPLNLSANDVSLNGSISNLGLYLGVINGVLYGHVGPKITILIGVLLVSFGFICNYLLLSGIGFPASLPLLCFFSFVAQFGSSFLQTAAMSTGVRNFPALSRGQIGGLVKGTFALASSTLGEYYLALFSTNTLNYLLFVAIYVPCMALICLPFINLIPKETVERYQEENERSQLTLHARLFEHAADAKDKEKEKDKDKDQISNAAGKVNGGGEGVNDAEEEKSKSWRELAGRPAALQVELATLSQTVTMVDSSTPTNGIAALVGLAQANSEGTVSLRFNDKELERKNSHTLPSPDVLRSPSAAAATVAKTAKTVSVKVPPRSKRPLNVVYRVLAKLSPSGPLNPQTMMYGYLILAFSLGIYVCIVAAIEAKETVSQGLRIGGFILTDLLAISFILVGASFGDFRIKFQRVVPADHHETKMHWLWQWLWRGAGQGGHGHGHAAADESKTLWYAVTTLNFYLLLLAQFCVAGSGLVLINNMSDISKAYAATDSSAVTNDPSLLVVIVGFGSFGGRVFCGFVSDRTIRYVTRPMYHSMAAFLSSFCFALLASSLNYNALYAVALIEGFAYGVAFSTMTSMAADLFGPTHHAAIYGALDLGPCAGSISFAYLIKNVYYSQGTNVPASQLKTLGNYCFGYTCFQNTFIICCCATLFASTLSLAVHFRTKEVYSKLREKLEAMRRTEAEKKKQQIEMLKQQRELEEEDAQKLEKLEQEEAADATLPTEVKAPPQNQELEEKHQEQHEDKTAANAIAAPRGSVSASSNTDGDASKVVKFHIHNLEHEFEHQQQQQQPE